MSIIKKIIYYLFIGLILLLIFNLGKDIYRLMHADQRLEQAKKRLETIKKENQKLKSQEESSKKQFYIEKEIRDKLGMAKPDETVVILPEELDTKDIIKTEEEKENLSNWQKWLNVFW